MRISAKSLLNYINVNSFSYGNQWIVRDGDANTLYFQLIDLDKASFRYMAGIGGSNQPTSMIVTFPSIDDSKVINLNATQDADDPSIWSISMPSTSTPNTGNVIFKLTEGSAVRTFNVLQMIAVEFPSNDGSDGTIPNNF